MDIVNLLLRIVHVGGGVLWVGGSALFFFYLEPAISRLGPDAEKFVDEVVNRRRLPIYFVSTSTLVVLSGAVMLWRDSNGLQATWISSPMGLAFTIGGVAALFAWLGGTLLIPRTLGQLAAIGAEIRAGGGPPNPELAERMRARQEWLRLVGLVDIVLLAVAVVAMATARYLG